MRNELETEALHAHRSAVEARYVSVQAELNAILDANETITLENKAKDARIAEYERDFKAMHARNELEMEQRLLERRYLMDDLEHELDVAQTLLRRAQLEKGRSQALETDNVALQEACAKIREDITNTGAQHALEIHKLNAEMRQRRIQLENLLRKELTTRDVSLQNNAFSKLEEGKKQALLANSKIKDELRMLRMGLASLSDRYDKNTKSIMDAKHRLDDLDGKSAELAVIVKELSELKHVKNEAITRVREEIKAFGRNKAEMDAALQTLESPEQLQINIEKLDVLHESEMRSIALWLERRRLLGLLRKELNVLVKLDKSRLAPAPNDSTNNAINKRSMSRNDDVPLKRSIDLPSILAEDDSLREGFRALIGCDSVCVDGYDANPSDNIAGWIAAQVLTIWATTTEQWDLAATNNAMSLAMPSMLASGRFLPSQNEVFPPSEPLDAEFNVAATRPTTGGTVKSHHSLEMGLRMTETDIVELLSKYGEDTFVPTEEDVNPGEGSNKNSPRENISASRETDSYFSSNLPRLPAPEALRLVGGPFQSGSLAPEKASLGDGISPIVSRNKSKAIEKLLVPEKLFRLSSDPNKDIEPPISVSRVVMAPSHSTSALNGAREKVDKLQKVQSLGLLSISTGLSSSPKRGGDSEPANNAPLDPLSKKSLKFIGKKRGGR